MVTAGGKLYSCGNNKHGPLGHGVKENRAVPTEVEALEGVVSAAVGEGDEDDHVQGYPFACTRAGAVFSWGYAYGETGTLGHGDKADRRLQMQLGLLWDAQVGF